MKLVGYPAIMVRRTLYQFRPAIFELSFSRTDGAKVENPSATHLWRATKVVLSSILLRHLHPLLQAQLPSSLQSLGRDQHYE